MKTLNKLALIAAIAAAALAGCPTEGGGAPLTKKIIVPAITEVKNPLDFGKVSDLSGWDANFPAADVTYTLILSQNGDTKATVNSTSATSISAYGQAEGVYTLTQTFYYKEIAIPSGSRSVAVMITGNVFDIGVGMAISETDFDSANLIGLTLNLSK